MDSHGTVNTHHQRNVSTLEDRDTLSKCQKIKYHEINITTPLYT